MDTQISFYYPRAPTLILDNKDYFLIRTVYVIQNIELMRTMLIA